MTEYTRPNGPLNANCGAEIEHIDSEIEGIFSQQNGMYHSKNCPQRTGSVLCTIFKLGRMEEIHCCSSKVNQSSNERQHL